MTFHAYHRARRLGLALAEVCRGQDLNAVGLRHGIDSASGFRDAFTRLFGRPPGNGRAIDCLRARWLDTPLGAMLAVAGVADDVGENGYAVVGHDRIGGAGARQIVPAP